ncbi:MAG: decarboxylating 6-phosphogluconate dehydrogenase [Deltaproteobacteria bacterium]|nr:decarboxylating 6-phosphogluconate dehydrogenase [Deltaproteobacteria bacterium]
MQLAMIGLGRMGINMARRLIKGGHEVVGYNRTREKTEQLVQEGATGAFSIPEVVEKLRSPRIVWLMLPAGQVIDEHLDRFKEILSPGDMVIDGGNTYYRDDIRRADLLSDKDIRFMDVGVSGGIWGLEKGYCLMAGGKKNIFTYLEPVFQTLAPEEGYLLCGDVGAGHYVKMVHNAIEYGMMQAYGEGFDILNASPYADTLVFADVAHLWNQGSVVRSWLLELAERAFQKNERLSDIKGQIEDSGGGRWTLEQAIDAGVSVPVIALSLMRRFESQARDSFSNKVVAALRREFGGHETMSVDKKRGD